MISFLKFLKEIVCIEPMKTKLVQGVYFRWMAVKLKSKMTELYTTHVTPQEENFISKHCNWNVLSRNCGGEFEIKRIYFVKESKHVKIGDNIYFICFSHSII